MSLLVRLTLSLLGFLYSAVVLFGMPTLGHADPDSKAQRITEMPGHILSTRNRQDSIATTYLGKTLSQIESGNVPNQVPSWMQGADPKWYEGNTPLSVPMAFFEDFIANLGFGNFPSHFLDCFNFDIDFGDFCYKKVLGVKIPIGFNFTYRFPVQQVLSRRFFQNRYLPDAYYSAVQSSGLYELLWYEAAKSVHAPLAKVRASAHSAFSLNTKSWAAYIPTHGPILPNATMISSNFPLDQPDQRGRYDGGILSESGLTQLEYSIGPTLLHTAWSVVAQYFPVLQVLPCVPPAKIPVPFGSDDPALIQLTREPLMGFMLSGDKKLKSDLTEWLKDPSVCQRWMMNKTRPNIPHDLMEHNQDKDPMPVFIANNPLSALIAAVPNSDVLVPLSNSALSKFNRMCTGNWGGSIPFTTVHQLHDSPFISAGKNFEKAIRLGVGIDKTWLSKTAAKKYFKYYPLDKSKDAYQLTYPDEWECKDVGSPGLQPFGNAQNEQIPGEFGLYSMSHWWTIPKCCLKFGKIGDVVAKLAQFGATGFPADLTDPTKIFGAVNVKPLPDLTQIIKVPSSIKIPNVGIPGMPTNIQLPNQGSVSYPKVPDLPF